jgi:CheY-like chemotaxis protein
LTANPFPYRILIVEDEPSLRQLGKMLFEAQGYEVRAAEDGFEGLAALKPCRISSSLTFKCPT